MPNQEYKFKLKCNVCDYTESHPNLEQMGFHALSDCPECNDGLLFDAGGKPPVRVGAS